VKTATIQAQQKWEYQCLTRKSETYLNKELNELGQQGWELASVIFGKDTKGSEAWIAFLKRPFVGHSPGGSGGSGEAAKSEGVRAVPSFDADGEEFEIRSD